MPHPDGECLVFLTTGMPKEIGPQALPGCLPAETCPEDHQIPAHAQGYYTHTHFFICMEYY